MIRRILLTLSSATLADWMAAMVFAAAFVGCVEAPWIARAMPSAPAVVASRSSHASHVSPLRASIRIAKEK
jgi:hypothetical protein